MYVTDELVELMVVIELRDPCDGDETIENTKESCSESEPVRVITTDVFSLVDADLALATGGKLGVDTLVSLETQDSFAPES